MMAAADVARKQAGSDVTGHVIDICDHVAGGEAGGTSGVLSNYISNNVLCETNVVSVLQNVCCG